MPLSSMLSGTDWVLIIVSIIIIGGVGTYAVFNSQSTSVSSLTLPTGASFSTPYNESLTIVSDGRYVAPEDKTTLLNPVSNNVASNSWSNLSNFPSGCPAGQAVQVIGSSLTCVSLGTGSNDSRIGELVNGKWCDYNGTNINCTQNTPSGSGTNYSDVNTLSVINSLDLNNSLSYSKIDTNCSVDGSCLNVVYWADANIIFVKQVDANNWYVLKNDFNTLGDQRYYLKTNPDGYITSAGLASYLLAVDANNLFAFKTDVNAWGDLRYYPLNSNPAGYLTSSVDTNCSVYGSCPLVMYQQDANAWFLLKNDLNNLGDARWIKLTDFNSNLTPQSCPAGQALRILGVTPTCIAVGDTNTVTANFTDSSGKWIIDVNTFESFYADKNIYQSGNQVCDISGNCVTSTTYRPATLTVSGGSTADTNIQRIWYYDDLNYNISEGAGANPLDVNIYFTNVNQVVNQIVVREYYTGSTSHNIQVQLWDYGTNSWQDYFQFVGQNGYSIITIPIYDANDHIGTNDRNVILKLHHVETGNPSHKLFIDFAWLIYGSSVGASSDLSGYAKYNFGNNNFDGNGNFTTDKNIYATYFFGNGAGLSNLTLTPWTSNIDAQGFNLLNTNNLEGITTAEVLPVAFPDNGGTSYVDMNGNIGLWHFDENSGTVYDSSGNGLDGNNYGGVTMGEIGQIDQAILLDGSSAYFSVPDNTLFDVETGDFSISFWVYPTSFSGDKDLYDSLKVGDDGVRNNAFALIMNDSDGKIKVFTQGAYTTFSAKSLSINNWNHIVLVRKAGVGYYYIDGKQDASSFSFDTNLVNNSVTMGKYRDSNGGYFEGLFDETALMDRDLNSTEILDIYYYQLGIESSKKVNIINDLNVAGNAWVNGAFLNDITFNRGVTIYGKLNISGGSDPPYVLYNKETFNSILNRLAVEVPYSKLNGLAMFWDGNKLYGATTDPLKNKTSIYSIPLTLVGVYDLPVDKTTIQKDEYYFDSISGTVKKTQITIPTRTELKKGLTLDKETGKIYNCPLATVATNNVLCKEIPLSQATITVSSIEAIK